MLEKKYPSRFVDLHVYEAFYGKPAFAGLTDFRKEPTL